MITRTQMKTSLILFTIAVRLGLAAVASAQSTDSPGPTEQSGITVHAWYPGFCDIGPPPAEPYCEPPRHLIHVSQTARWNLPNPNRNRRSEVSEFEARLACVIRADGAVVRGYKIDPDYGRGVARDLGLELPLAAE